MTTEIQQASLTWRVSPDMMCILNDEGAFVAVNPAWAETLGWSRERMIGAPFLDFLHPDDVGRSMAAFEEVKSGKPVLRFENRYRTDAGEYRWLQWVAVPEGERFYCTARDVTAEKEHVEQIAAQQAEARMREQFIAVLGHDLRNPLAAIAAGANMLMRRAQDERTAEIVGHMQGSVSRMAELINNVMDMARLRQGSGMRLERRPTSTLGRDIEQVADEISLVFPGVAIVRNIDIARTVTCDAARITQLVSNLLANAAVHGHEGQPIRINAKDDAGRLEISVCNTGDPISDETREKLFQPYFRGEIDGAKQGLGLGLYIAAQIAAAHDGALGVSSQDGETCFTLDIPSA